MPSQPQIGFTLPTTLREQIFHPADLDRLRAKANVVLYEGTEPPSEAEAIELLQNCTVGVGSWRTPHPSPTLVAALPDLRLWHHAAGSVKHMFGPYLEDKPLQIASCAPAIAECVAEMVVGELIVGLKRVYENGAANKGGPVGKPENSRALSSSKIGIIGASQVGQRVIGYLKPFSPEIWLYDPFVTPERAAEMGVQLAASPQELCAQCHAVTLHTPPLPATRHIMGAAEFQAMPDDGVFINTSRGMCVDEAALIAELEKGRLFAFLDVSDPEPTPSDSPFRSLPNVIYTSHIAGGREFKIGRQVVDDILAYIDGGKPKFVVTAEMLERMA